MKCQVVHGIGNAFAVFPELGHGQKMSVGEIIGYLIAGRELVPWLSGEIAGTGNTVPIRLVVAIAEFYQIVPVEVQPDRAI